MPLPPTGYGGIKMMVDLLARGLHARGHEVTLFAPEGTTSPARVISPLPAPGIGAIGDLWTDAYHVAAAYRHAGEFDVVHDHTFLGPALGSVCDGPTVVHTLHGPWVPDLRRYYALLHDRIQLVAISETQRRANGDVRYAATIPNGIDLDRYPVWTGEREDYLVYIGRANCEKAPERAVELAHRAGMPLKLVVKRAEPAEQAYWKQEVAPRLGSTDEVLGELGHDDKVELLRKARAFVFPIEWEEPFGLVMAEALACGTPVVATPRGAARDIVEDGVTGWLRSSIDELAVRLHGVDIGPEACRARAEQLFSAGEMVARYDELFARLVRSRRRRFATADG